MRRPRRHLRGLGLGFGLLVAATTFPTASSSSNMACRGAPERKASSPPLPPVRSYGFHALDHVLRNVAENVALGWSAIRGFRFGGVFRV